jgi:glycosyltransferase involved in cell wall biosynthesis
MSFAKRLVLNQLISGLRSWDEGAARQPDHFIANSQTVAERIQRCYNRVCEVIHPPIDVNRFRPSDEQGDYYLVLSRLISYKRLDLAVQACTQLRRRLIVIGDGPERERLAAEAGPTVQFMGRLSDKDVEYYAARCRALIFPGEEDFGMAPLELAAAGRPTIAYRAGGAMETIIEGVTGTFFDSQTAEDLASAIEHFEKQDWDRNVLRRHAQNFSVDVFRSRMRAFLAHAGMPLRDTAPVPFPMVSGLLTTTPADVVA